MNHPQNIAEDESRDRPVPISTITSSSFSGLASNTLWNTGASFFWALGSLLASIFIARSLGPEKTGTVNFIVWLTATIGLITGFSVPETLLRYRAEFLSGPSTLAALLSVWITKVFILASAIGIFTTITVLYWVLAPADFSSLLPGALVLFLVQRLGYLGRNYLIGGKKFRQLAYLSIWSTVGQILGLFFLVATTPNISTALMVYTVSFAILAWPVFELLRESIATSFTRNVLPVRRLWSYSTSTWGATLVSSLMMNRAEIFFIERYLTIQDVAFYSAGFTLVAILVQGTTMITGALLPHFAGQYSRQDWQGIERTVHNVTLLLGVIFVPICLITSAVSKSIVTISYGPEFSSSAIVVSALSLAVAFNTVSSVTSTLFHGIERQSIITWAGIFSSIAIVTLGFVIVPRYGLSAAALGKALIQISASLFGLVYTHCVIRIKIPVKPLLKIVAASSAAAGCAYMINWYITGIIGLVLAWVTGLIVYLLLVRAIIDWGHDEQKYINSILDRWSLVEGMKPFLRHILKVH